MSNAALQAAVEAAAFDAARSTLRGYRSRSYYLPNGFWGSLALAKADAIQRSDELTANAAWCLEALGSVQDLYVRAVRECQRHLFYDGWTTFERAELAVCTLGRHFEDVRGEYGVPHVREYVPKFQKLFPYRVFFSPGFIKKEVRCSICDHIITPRWGCGHRVFGLYSGQIAGRVITQVEMDHISVVERPVQKYSVLFPEGIEYNYALIAYVTSALRTPWDSWEVSEQTRLVTDARFAGVRPKDPCPCNSGKRFKRCHLSNALVEQPHFEFLFETPPPSYVPRFYSNIAVHDARGPNPTREESQQADAPSDERRASGAFLRTGSLDEAGTSLVRRLEDPERDVFVRARLGKPLGPSTQ